MIAITVLSLVKVTFYITGEKLSVVFLYECYIIAYSFSLPFY